jgi:hypothetical protein
MSTFWLWKVMSLLAQMVYRSSDADFRIAYAVLTFRAIWIHARGGNQVS